MHRKSSFQVRGSVYICTATYAFMEYTWPNLPFTCSCNTILYYRSSTESFTPKVPQRQEF
jgi:hypothetical protein